MGETHKSLLKLVNASGFLFQLRVENEILATKATPVDVRAGVAQLLLTAASILGIAVLLFC